MGKFDIYKHTVRLDTTAGDDEEYVLLPVGGDQIDKLLALALRSNKSEEGFMNSLTGEDVKVLRELVEATLVSSYPNEDAKKMKMFAQQNFTVFMEPVLNVNMGKAMNVAKDKALKG